MMIYSETANYLMLDKASKVKKDFNFDQVQDLVVNNYFYTPSRKTSTYSESIQTEVVKPTGKMYTEQEVENKILTEREEFMKKGQKALELAREDFFEEAEQAFELAKEDFITTGEKILQKARKDWEAEYTEMKKPKKKKKSTGAY
jgi:hypothetical protein